MSEATPSSPTPFDRVIAAMAAQGFSQKGLCRKAGLNGSTIAQAKSRGSGFDLPTLRKLAAALDMPLDELLGEAPAGSGIAPDPSQSRVPLGAIRPSPLNPRKTFDDTTIAELADSVVQTGGLLQNLVVRLDPVDDGERVTVDGVPWRVHWIVAGERRWRALTLLAEQNRLPPDMALFGIPANIRTMTDAQHLQFAIIENLQREDVNAMEEAEGFAQLQASDPDVWTPRAIAEKIGRTPRHVQLRLALVTKLIPEAQHALRTDGIKIAQARVLATMPAVRQAELLGHAGDRSADALRRDALRDMVPVDRAVFDVEKSGLEIWSDPDDGGRRHFVSRQAFLARQKDAVNTLAGKLRREEKPAFVRIVNTWQLSMYPPGGDGTVITFDEHDGAAEIHRGRKPDRYDKTPVTPAERHKEAVKAAFLREFRTAARAFHDAVRASLDVASALRLFLIDAASTHTDRPLDGWSGNEARDTAGLNAVGIAHVKQQWTLAAALGDAAADTAFVSIVAARIKVPLDQPPHPVILSVATALGVPVPPVVLIAGRARSKEIERRAATMPIEPDPQLDIEDAIAASKGEP